VGRNELYLEKERIVQLLGREKEAPSEKGGPPAHGEGFYTPRREVWVDCPAFRKGKETPPFRFRKDSDSRQQAQPTLDEQRKERGETRFSPVK